MDIYVQKVASQGNERWLVTAGSIQLHFNDQQSALDFSTRLKERVEAPHELPAEVHKLEAGKTDPASL
jgi:hypothetical protein